MRFLLLFRDAIEIKNDDPLLNSILLTPNIELTTTALCHQVSFSTLQPLKLPVQNKAVLPTKESSFYFDFGKSCFGYHL